MKARGTLFGTLLIASLLIAVKIRSEFNGFLVGREGIEPSTNRCKRRAHLHVPSCNTRQTIALSASHCTPKQSYTRHCKP
jgi:hypothetical protein